MAYSANMNELLSKSYAEIVSESKVDRNNGCTWYLPHHPVFNKNKPGEVRIIFDCAASYQGVSLNDKVLQGPDLTNKLVGVLLRFRQDRIAVMADIESMFHQVNVNVHHRDYLRFLWWPNGLLSDKPSVFRMNVHLFGGIWSPSCCNFVLKYTAKEHQSEYSDEVVKAVSDNIYVDDFLKSFATVNEATQLVQQVGSLLENGGFRLTKWVSNSEEVISAIPPAERSDRGCCLCLPSGGTLERALGVKWNTLTDTFSFSTIDTNKPATR